MKKIKDLSYGVITILIITIIMMFFYDTGEQTFLKELDLNKDGIVSRGELSKYLNRISNDNTVKKQTMIKKIKTGFIRGFLMGVILQDLEGGMVLALILGIINPMLHNIEAKI